jgi:hypothetical protein
VTDLRQYTIYDHPRDYPDAFVVRAWEIGPGTMTPGQPRTAPTLEAARKLIPPGLYCLGRAADDDSTIVETWT